MIDRNSSTAELEAVVEAFWVPNPYPPVDVFMRQYFAKEFVAFCRRNFDKKIPIAPIATAIAGGIEHWYELEPRTSAQYHGRFETDDAVEHGRYRDVLLRLVQLSEDDPQEWVAAFLNWVIRLFEPYLKALPSFVFTEHFSDGHESGATVPVYTLMEDVGQVLTEMIEAAFADFPFYSVAVNATRSYFNEMGEKVADGGEAILPHEYNGPPEEIIRRFFGNQESRFGSLFYIPVQVPKEESVEEPAEPVIAERDWYSHALLLAQPGAGKTNAIRWRIMQLIPQIRDGRASLILLEPKGVLTREMLTLARTQGLEDRVVFIDPVDAPVSVNIFDRGDNSPRAVNETMAHVARVLGTITLALTDMQMPTLTFAIRALFSLPEQPSLHRLIDILRRGKQALPLEALEPSIRNFFEYDYTPDRNIVGRLNSMFANPVYETLFATDRPTFNIGREMQAGKLIVINAGLSDTLYGRFWIEEVSRTIRARFDLPEQLRVPTTFIIDEAQEYIAEDLHFARILDTAREARIGMFIAAHHMDQIKSPHVRSSLYNCVLKFVARTNADIHNLCRSMGTTETDFLTTVPQYQFAFHQPNMNSAKLVKLPLIEFAPSKREDLAFFSNPKEQAHSSRAAAAENIADHSPRAAIIEMGIALETAVKQVLIDLSLYEVNADLNEMIQALRQHRIIDRTTADVFHELRRIRNKAAHEANAAFNREEALSFQQAVDRVIAILQSRPPTHKPPSEGGTGWR